MKQGQDHLLFNIRKRGNQMKKTGFLLAAILLLAMPLQALAQDAYYVFAWANSGDHATVYVSDGSRLLADPPMKSDQYREYMQRWKSALEREGVETWSLSNTVVGAPSGIRHESQGDAEAARRQFINRERNEGRTVRVVSW